MKPSSRLESHRDAYEAAMGKMSLLSYPELELEEKKFIAQELFSIVSKRKDRDPYAAWTEVLISWGVMCPHPSERLSKFETHEECKSCGTDVISFERKKKDEKADEKSVRKA